MFCMRSKNLSIETGNLVWQNIVPYLNGIRSIYISPIGAFHSIPFEDLPLTKHGTMSHAFHIYRLSSTRQLLTLHADYRKDAAVYGGLDYGISVKEMENDARERGFIRGAGDVEQLDFLEGTAKEANTIVKLINDNHKEDLKAELYSGKTGTEASFKALSGKCKRVLHIGTHGFYSPDETVDNYSFLTHTQQQAINTEDRTLMQSGLYLAGVDNKLNHEIIPDGIDDGILTAQEVSTLDFRGMEMVSLSACQTAQGKVTSDGVFGLQRGFKKAGANSILMSLWKVDDEATCLLMNEFYKNWIVEEMTKHEALEEAKKTVRSHKEKGWDKPEFWAAFVLLDGLDL